jgi:hypothetical protein
MSTFYSPLLPSGAVAILEAKLAAAERNKVVLEEEKRSALQQVLYWHLWYKAELN